MPADLSCPFIHVGQPLQSVNFIDLLSISIHFDYYYNLTTITNTLNLIHLVTMPSGRDLYLCVESIYTYGY